MKQTITIVFFTTFVVLGVLPVMACENHSIRSNAECTHNISSHVKATLGRDIDEYIRFAVRFRCCYDQDDQERIFEQTINAMGNGPVDRSCLYVNERTKRVARFVIASKTVRALLPKSRLLNNKSITDFLQIQLNKVSLDAVSPVFGKCINKEIVNNLIENRCKDFKERTFPPNEILYY